MTRVVDHSKTARDIALWLGSRAIQYDRRADAVKDGVVKMQGASLAAAANDIISGRWRDDQ